MRPAPWPIPPVILLLPLLGILAACGSDDAGAAPAEPNGDVPPGSVPPAESFVEVRAKAVGVGDTLACAITPDDRIVCWGGYTSEQVRRNALGKNAYLIETPGTPTQLSVGTDHACARFADGSVRCWGARSRGKLGEGSSSVKVEPETAVLVAGLVDADSVSAGYEHTCAVAKGKVFCWGYNTSGEVGDGTRSERMFAVEVPGIGDAVSVTAGSALSCALVAGGRVKCWGSNRYGQILALERQVNEQVPTPTEVPGVEGVSAIEAGATVTCGLAAGKVLCWGADSGSTQGAGKPPTPVAIVGVDGASSFSLRKGHETSAAPGCAVTPRGILCWDSPKPDTPVVGILVEEPGATAVAVGDASRCGIFLDQRLKCWGSNATSLLGDGSFAAYPNPVYVAGIEGAVAITTASNRTCAAGGDGKVRCWGGGSGADLDGAMVDVPELEGATALVYGSRPCGAIDGGVRCATELAGAKRPAFSVSGVAGAVELRLVKDGGCARLEGGALACWPSTEAPVAVTIPGAVSVRRLFGALSGGICSLQDDGIGCWTELPTAANAASRAPLTGELAGSTELAGGAGYQCGAKPAGVSCTGDPRNVIGPIPGTEGASKLVVGGGYGCAVIGGKVQCWGGGYGGQLGASSFSEAKTPVVVGGVGVPDVLVAGAGHTCALEGGRVKCWGGNEGGAISPRAGSRTKPTQVRLRW